MSSRALFLPLVLLATPAAAAELTCDGAFAIDSSEARLVETFGRENVVTGEWPGPEGTTMIATRVFDDDPERRLVFVWWDEGGLADPSIIELPPADSVAGLHAGMTVKEVEALNGEPFTMTGFFWDYGGYAWFQSGTLAALPGDCVISAFFDPRGNTPEGTDDSIIMGDVEVPSGEPLLGIMDVRVERVQLGYVHPDFRDPEPAEDTRG